MSMAVPFPCIYELPMAIAKGIHIWDSPYAYGEYTHMGQNIMTVLNITMNDMILMHNPSQFRRWG